MKNLVLIFLAVLLCPSLLYSSPNTGSPNSEVTIPEDETKKFTDNPVAYIIENFDLRKHPGFLESEVDAEYRVEFICSKGNLVAKYDSKGELISTRQKFKNISVPPVIMAEIYQKNKGWEVIDINLKASGEGESLTSARYKILLKKGDESKIFIKKIRY